ncbi:MAG TPA: hypothetical protein VER11_33545 [Polyangiaceae bacterium]|nr:hypothetical protein [Polyangiaceae bacterium]
MSQQPKSNAKQPSHAQHPETQRSRAKTGVPGTEQSKVKSQRTDVRHAHDKDGNTQQRAR